MFDPKLLVKQMRMMQNVIYSICMAWMQKLRLPLLLIHQFSNALSKKSKRTKVQSR